MALVNYFCEDVDFKPSVKLKAWVKKIVLSFDKKCNGINYIFCSDEYLHKINLQYLQHDTYTDIITFDQAEYEDELEGDIFVSIERVKENAQLQGTTFDNEIARVLVHGLLHLIGYDDLTDEQEAQMREKETFYIENF